jgi:anti-anti-sigma regulatory factor
VLNDSRRLNKQFVLFGLSTAVEEVFRLTHVIRIFRIVQSEQEALGDAPAKPVGGGV